MKACLSVWGPIGLFIPARRATRRTIRPAPWRSIRWRLAPTKMGPARRSPIAKSTAPLCAAPGDGHRLPALAQHSQGAVAPLQAEGFDVGAKGLRHPQAVQRQ